MQLKLLPYLLLCSLLGACASYQSFPHDGMQREYLLHIPKNLPPKAPLLLVLHGYTNKAAFIRFYSNMNKVANRKGFAVVYPQGSVGKTGETHWNAQLELSEVDDIGFLSSLADSLAQRHQLDPQRTFVMGLSNGGFMAYTLACSVPQRFRAIASVIGTMSGKTWSQRDSLSQPMPVLQISGLEDKVVPADGSMGPKNGWGGAPPIDSVMRFWSQRNGCTTLDRQYVTPQTSAYYYESCQDSAQVWYIEIENLRHTWPRKGKHGIKTNELIWAFFEQYL